MVDKIIAWLDAWKRLAQALEHTLVDNFAATVPWLAPTTPAWMVYDGLVNGLHMPWWIALMAAATVEFLGMSTITTTLQFWDFNDTIEYARAARAGAKKSKTKARRPARTRRVPVGMAGAATAFYLIVVLVVNVLLDQEAELVERVVKALLSTLSVVGAIMLALRGQHSRRLKDMADRKLHAAELRASKVTGKFLPASKVTPIAASEKFGTEKSSKVTSENFGTAGGKEQAPNWRRVPLEERIAIASMDVQQVVKLYGVDERSGYNWITWAVDIKKKLNSVNDAV